MCWVGERTLNSTGRPFGYNVTCATIGRICRTLDMPLQRGERGQRGEGSG